MRRRLVLSNYELVKIALIIGSVNNALGFSHSQNLIPNCQNKVIFSTILYFNGNLIRDLF